MPPHDIPDAEIILKHIPGKTSHQGSPKKPRITSKNFELRHDIGEKGSSATQQSITSADKLLTLPTIKATPASGVAGARAGDIRSLGLEVIADPTEHDPGHVLIVSANKSLDDHECRTLLASLFKYVLPPASPPGS